MSRYYVYWLTVAALAASSSSCSLIRRGNRGAPPPVIAGPPTNPPAPVENPQVPPPPKVDQADSLPIEPVVNTQIPAKPPVKIKQPKRPVRKPAPPVVRAQTPTPAPAVQAAPEPLVLAPVLSAEQQDALNRTIDTAVGQAESSLAAVANRQLNPAQQANADRVRSFVSQVQATRANDLVTAKTLAERAAILAQSLAAELR